MMKFHTAHATEFDEDSIRPAVIELDGQYVSVLVLGTYNSLEAAQAETERWWNLFRHLDQHSSISHVRARRF